MELVAIHYDYQESLAKYLDPILKVQSRLLLPSEIKERRDYQENNLVIGVVNVMGKEYDVLSSHKMSFGRISFVRTDSDIMPGFIAPRDFLDFEPEKESIVFLRTTARLLREQTPQIANLTLDYTPERNAKQVLERF